MSTSNVKKSFRKFIDNVRRNRLARLKDRLSWKKKEMEVLSATQKSSHSLLWVWEFSKKAVLVCFLFYIVVQVYAMTVMVVYCDFANLGELINQTGEIVQNCVFAYFIKAGVENVGKIMRSTEDDDSVG